MNAVPGPLIALASMHPSIVVGDIAKRLPACRCFDESSAGLRKSRPDCRSTARVGSLFESSQHVRIVEQSYHGRCDGRWVAGGHEFANTASEKLARMDIRRGNHRLS